MGKYRFVTHYMGGEKGDRSGSRHTGADTCIRSVCRAGTEYTNQLDYRLGKLHSSTIFLDGLYFLMIFVYYGNRASVGWGQRPFGSGPIKRARRMQAMATGEAALLAGNKQESSGCVLAFFRIFRGKCSHLGLCSGSSASSQTK